MKVATLNYHNAYNYGAVLQAAALQRIVEKLGMDCDIIDYRNIAVENQYKLRLLPANKIISNIRNDLTLFLFINKKKKNFQKWMDSYKKTVPIDKSQLKTLNEKYDKFIVGSDQVWNMQCHDADESYFLDFVNDSTKKIAYAASFGAHDIPQHFRELYRKHISSFSKISVREKRGEELVKQLTGKKAVSTMDPVLLVGKNYWISRSSKQCYYKDYIFVYQLGHSETIPKYVKQLKKCNQKKVVFVTGHTGNYIYYNVLDTNCSNVGPEIFLSLLINSSYIVTNSFHATALSVLFEKQFSVVIEGGEKQSFNSRIYNLLEHYCLVNRIQCDFNPAILSERIDYTVFNDRFENDRKQSLDFLKNAIMG